MRHKKTTSRRKNTKAASKMKSKKTAFYILAALGVVISIYLTIEHYNNSILVCPTSGIVNCSTVLTSVYSSFYGVPTAVLLLIWFIVAPFALIHRNDNIKFLWSLAGIVGVAYSLTAFTLLDAICIWCSSADILIIVILAMTYFVIKPSGKVHK
jgi:uncharacterized membrane protein